MTLSELFDSFHRSAFRLEGLSVYSVSEEKEALEVYQEHGQIPAEFGSDWVQFVKGKTDAGKTIRRLRLLSDELTDYEKFELNAYTGIAGGEGIRFVKRNDHPYEYDFWLFDDKWLVRMNYDNDGRFIESAVKDMSKEDIDHISYWLSVYESAEPIADVIRSRGK